MILREVEKVEVTCLADNNIDLVLPNTEVACRPALTRNWYKQPLVAEHGFCVALTLQAEGVKHRLLFDSGLDPSSASRNADVLLFDLSNCESLISSHGHIDHAGGLLNLRKKMNSIQRIPLILHEDAFRNRLVKFQDGRTIDLPAPNRSFLTDAGYDVIEKHSASSWIGDRVITTGEIPRTNSFEKGFPNHYSEVEDGKMEPDPLIKDDQAIILTVKDKGLVVITGCGHAGIINTLNYAKELTGEDRICSVLGGMHLSGGLFEAIIPTTVKELEKMKPTFVVPCHCSGLKAMTEIARKMPSAFIQNSVGTNYTF
jgi:7,8-dihydropterin-6-yl-methyl-4-(beta-D-ribofuranosyl)aminobenzene 5'-phosphate synthase